MSTPHGERAHAKLSPSGASRWMNCPGSIAACEGYQDKSSIYANQGSAAHELAERCITTGFDADRFADNKIDLDETDNGLKFNSPKKPSGRVFVVDDQMQMGVQMYVDYCREVGHYFEKHVKCKIEERLSMEHIVPGMFGTGDFLAMDRKTKTLHVIDLKYGRGVVVEPEQNKQLMLYGLGALAAYPTEKIEHVRLTVVQPRAFHPDGEIRSWELSVKDLNAAAQQFTDAALETEKPNAPLASGEWCKFCPHKPKCPELRKMVQPAAVVEFGGTLEMSREDMTQWNEEAQFVRF